MSYKRYFTEQQLNIDINVTLTGSEFHHMSNVMRQKKGDSVILLNGDGYDYTARIDSIDKKCAQLTVTDKEENLRKAEFKLAVMCALLKGDSTEVQAVKLSELGCCRFIPFISKNCEAAKSANKEERIKRKVLESAKQCKRAYPMQVSPILSFDEALKSVSDMPNRIMAWECESRNSIKAVLDKSLKQAVLMIGPEGGFTQYEAEKAIKEGFTTVTLGKTVLKADTAATAGAAALLFCAGEWDGL